MPIAGTTLGLIMLAAVCHATWNSLGKLIPDRLVSASLIGLAYTAVGVLAAPFVPVPDAAAWPFLLTSSVLQTAYLLLLMSAYRLGEFGRTYPLTRGVSPLLVTVFSLAVLGERMTWWQLVGIALVCAGLGGLVVVRGVPRRGTGQGLAVLSGVCIATYTLLDGVGVRHSGSAIGYAMWLFLIQGPMVPLIAWVRRGRRLPATIAPYWRVGLIGGLLSVASYAIVVWAQSRTPLAAVATLRETSVVLAAFLGRLVFKERLGAGRVVAAGIVATGIVAIAFS